MLLKVYSAATSPQVIEIVQELEKAIARRPLQIVAKQRRENMGEILTSYAKPEKVDVYYSMHFVVMFIFIA